MLFWLVGPFSVVRSLEVQPRGERKAAAGNRVVCLVGSRGVSGRQAAEVGAADIRADEAPSRIVQHADCVDTDFEFLPFRQPDALDQVHVKAGVGRRLNPLPAECPDGAGSRALQNDVSR